MLSSLISWFFSNF